MSRQRKRHLQRQPIEESARLRIAEFVGTAGEVDAERHGHEREPDDLLLWVRLGVPIAGSVLSLFRRQLWERMHAAIPPGEECEKWLVVVQSQGKDLTTVSSSSKLEEFENDYDEP
jgi:hypothetical protein